jgi:hypothetical protein
MKNPPLSLAATVLSMVVGKALSQLRVAGNGRADNLADSIAGQGVAIAKSNSSSDKAKLFLKNPRQAGIYWSTSKGTKDIGLGSSGVVLSSAFAKNAEEGTTKLGDALGGTGSSALDSLLKTRHGRGDLVVTQDACVLRFKFTCQPPPQQPIPPLYKVELDFVFGSDNYPSNGKLVNEDLMGAFLNGVNIAVVDKKTRYISVNTLRNGPKYRDNPFIGRRRRYRTSMRGFTVPLTAVGTVEAGNVQELVFAVADGGRRRALPGRQGGTWLFIKGGSLRCIALTAPTTAPAQAPTSKAPTPPPTRSLYPTSYPTRPTNHPTNAEVPTVSPMPSVSAWPSLASEKTTLSPNGVCVSCHIYQTPKACADILTITGRKVCSCRPSGCYCTKVTKNCINNNVDKECPGWKFGTEPDEKFTPSEYKRRVWSYIRHKYNC